MTIDWHVHHTIFNFKLTNDVFYYNNEMIIVQHK